MSAEDIASVHYLDAACAASDFVYFATQLDSLDPYETTHTRMSILDLTDDQPWGYHDYEDNIVSVHAYRGDAKLLPDGSRFVALGRHGLVRFNRQNVPTFSEQIPGAGMLHGNLGGSMTHLREIGGQLWACGQRGQVYRRFGRDDWRHQDQGLFVTLKLADYVGRGAELARAMVSSGPMLNCLDGSSEHDVYVVGLQGFVAHFDGKRWQRVTLNTDEHLTWVRCYGPDEVWICGYNGTVLKGNARQGFTDVSTVDEHQTWVCLSKYQDRVYLSNEDGLYVYDGQRIEEVQTGLTPELQDGWRVDHADGVLWSIGIKDLARFDGQRWERIHHPDNERIDE